MQYNLDYYLNLAEKLVAHGCHALAVKDMAGCVEGRVGGQGAGANGTAVGGAGRK
jgi:pyruvate carboxylase